MRSITAHTAAFIRRELKAAFPHTRFTVRSSQFAGGDAVDVSWTDGPTRVEVRAVTRKYAYGTFDGSTDRYEYDNRRPGVPQAKYVNERREYSRRAIASAVAYLNRLYGWSLALVPTAHGGHRIDGDGPMDDGWGFRSHEVYRALAAQSLRCPNGHEAEVADAYCAECGAPLWTENWQ